MRVKIVKKGPHTMFGQPDDLNVLELIDIERAKQEKMDLPSA